jgi:hypothetical protein
VNSWPDLDEALYNVAKGIGKVVDNISRLLSSRETQQITPVTTQLEAVLSQPATPPESTLLAPSTVSIEQYTRKREIWSITGSMAIKRVSHGATLLQDGSMLVAGGAYASLSLVEFAEVYVPYNGIWSRTKGNLHVPRATSQNSLVTLANGKALLAGGTNATADVDYDSTELYDPATSMWSETGSLNTPRRGACIVSLKGGQNVLAAAGAHGPPDGKRFLVSTEMYDMSTGRWVFVGSLTVARDGASAVLLNDGRVLIAGGEGPWYVYGATAEIFDPKTNMWSVTSSMPWGWSGASMTVLPPPDGRVFVCGGANGYTAFSNAALFHPLTGQWQQVAPMSTPRAGHVATLLPGNRILVSGGGNHSGTLKSSEIYNVATGTWYPGPNLQVPRSSSLAVSEVDLPKSTSVSTFTWGLRPPSRCSPPN